MGRGPAVSQEPFTACASSPYPLRTPPGSSASIASKPAILAKIMHRRPAADLSGRGPIFAAMHAVKLALVSQDVMTTGLTGLQGAEIELCVLNAVDSFRLLKTQNSVMSDSIHFTPSAGQF